MKETYKPLNEISRSYPELKEKILAAWGSARDELKAPNGHRLAELLYKSLYYPEQIKSTEVHERPGFSRSETLTAKLPETDIETRLIPSETEFVSVIRHALSSEPHFENALHPGALETIEKLSDLGPICIWTTGDMYGSADGRYQGSKEQLKRAAISGLGALRDRVAADNKKPRHDILAMAAAENKFSLVPQIIAEAKKRNLAQLVVIEDRASNLEKIISATEHSGIEIFPIWVRQGLARNSFPRGEKSLEDWKADYHAIDSISELVPKLIAEGILDNSHAGFVVDYDDVLSDDEKRMKLQTQSVIHALKEHNWIN